MEDPKPVKISIAERNLNVGKVSHFRLRAEGKDTLTVICYEGGLSVYVWYADGYYLLAEVDLDHEHSEYYISSPGWTEMMNELNCTSKDLKETITICFTEAMKEFHNVKNEDDDDPIAF
jgi:hypothetical protein